MNSIINFINPSCRLATCTPRDENGGMDGLKGGGQARGPAPTPIGPPPAVGDGPRAVPNGGWYDTGAVHFRINDRLGKG